jgi:hypothetical protein
MSVIHTSLMSARARLRAMKRNPLYRRKRSPKGWKIRMAARKLSENIRIARWSHKFKG